MLNSREFEIFIQDSEHLNEVCKKIIALPSWNLLRRELIVLVESLLKCLPKSDLLCALPNKLNDNTSEYSLQNAVSFCVNNDRSLIRLRVDVATMFGKHEKMFSDLFTIEPLASMAKSFAEDSRYQMLTAPSLRVNSSSSVAMKVNNLLVDFYREQVGLRINLKRVPANIVTFSDGLKQPLEIFICADEPEPTIKERIHFGYKPIPEVIGRLEIKKSISNLLGHREPVTERALFVHQVIHAMTLIGDMEIDYDEFSNLDFKNLGNLMSLRDPAVAYGLFVDEALIKPEKEFWNLLVRRSQGTTLEEELFAHWFYGHVFDPQSLARQNLNERQVPISIVCSASFEPISGHMIKIQPFDGGIDNRILKLSLITPEQAAEEGAYIRLVSAS